MGELMPFLSADDWDAALRDCLLRDRILKRRVSLAEYVSDCPNCEAPTTHAAGRCKRCGFYEIAPLLCEAA